MAKSKVKIREGLKVTPKKTAKMRKKPGGSNVGEYKNLSQSQFAGPKGGAPKGTYPINTKERARAALSYAHNAPNPKGIKEAVYKKYPSLKSDKKNEK